MTVHPGLARLVLATTLLAIPGLLDAQGPPAFGGHYPAGIEGIKAASVPPPGLYLRDYNFFYWADHYKGGPPGFDVFAYINAPRIIWMTGEKFLGADYGCDVIVPLVYQDVDFMRTHDDSFGIGDIAVEPLILSWHFAQADLAFGYAFWAPTGDFDTDRPAQAGKDFWSNMFTLGGTWHPDKEKTWSLSALNRYEIHTGHDKFNITPGDTWTLEWGVAKTFNKTIDVGLIGYHQRQTTKDSGSGSSHIRDHVIAVGPEVNVVFPKIMLFVSARWAWEFCAKDRPEGNMVNLTVTKPF